MKHNATNEPKRDFALRVVEKLRGAGYQALWAGGCVRDLLAKRAPQDYDVATNARPEAVRELFGHRRTLTVGASFGVVIVVGTPDAGNVEVATFRNEGPYLDGRRPAHVVFSTAEEDARRRDFTINGMFYDPLADQVFDYVGGQRDLTAHVLRAIGDPRARMTEDKLRMLRAVRFTATLDFKLEVATADAIRAMAAEIHVVSAERIAQELRKMLVHHNRRRAIELADEVGLLEPILPELLPILPSQGIEHTLWPSTLRRLEQLPAPTFSSAMAALLFDFPETAEAISRRFKLSNQESDDTAWFLSRAPAVIDGERLTLAAMKGLLADPRAAQLLPLSRAAAIVSQQSLRGVERCEDYLAETPQHVLDPPPLITGNDLIALGLEPGERFRELLDAVRDAQLNETIATKEAALALVEQLQRA